MFKRKRLFAITAIAAQSLLIHPAKAESVKVKARPLLFQAAVEELHKNPQAADLPECTPTQAANGDLCIRSPATPPTADAAPATAGTNASGHKG